jgi:hypothetical protein
MMRGAAKVRASKGTEEILKFQPSLAKAIFRLDKLHSQLASERKDLVQRKQALSAHWLRSRLRKIRDLQDSLATAASIGRSLGDGLAWVFYREDPASLSAHSTHDPIRHIPNTTGGRGEVSFIQATQAIDGYFILYHGITTLLRHGDLSVFNLKTGRLAAIGELKTTRVGPKELSITVALMGAHDRELFQLLSTPSREPPGGSRSSFGHNLPAAVQARLGNQMHAATRVITPPVADKDISLSTSSPLQGLLRLLKERPRSDSHALKLSDSQVLLRVRQRESRLSARLLKGISNKPRSRPTPLAPSSPEYSCQTRARTN